ncbi:MAG: serine hydrolase [Candidatus Omnitrophota bacterium]
MRRKVYYLLCFFIWAVIFLFTITPKGPGVVERKVRALESIGESIISTAPLKEYEISFSVLDLRNPQVQISFNSCRKFPAASLIKVPILAAALNAVDEKKVTFSQKIIIDKNDLTGGSGVLKNLKQPQEFSFKELLELMITKSDNTATNKVISILGYKYLNDTFRKIGLKDTVIVRKMMDFKRRKYGIENYTSASDMASVFRKIYNQRLINKEFSQIALSFLKKQKVNDRLPLYLPKNVNIAHKTGLEKEVVHDAGIIFTRNGDYFICVLTHGVKDYSQAKKFIAKIALLIYNFYDNFE